MGSRLLLWGGADVWRAEAAEVDLQPDALMATGTQMGVDPVPYSLTYRLRTGPAYITRQLELVSVGAGWSRRLVLDHDGHGAWQYDAHSVGAEHLAQAGGDSADVDGALDCDLGFSPLMNTMPVLRHNLHRTRGEVDFLMAWVSVPDLAVTLGRRRYEHVAVEGDAAYVKYISGDYTAEIVLDHGGFVLEYPDLAIRVES